MGLLSRLKEISTGKLLAFLDEAERPEVMIPQLLKELGDQQRALQTAEAKSLAAVRAAQRKLEETLGRIQRLERGAELALMKGEEATAREALQEQVKLEKGLERQRKQVEQSQAILDDVRERKSELTAQIAAVQEKREQLQTTPGGVLPAAPESLLNKVARMEERVAEDEAGVDARREVGQRKRSLDERLIELERNDEIETRLNTLRKEQFNDG